MNVDPSHPPCAKINSKWLTDLNVRAKNIKSSEENTKDVDCG